LHVKNACPQVAVCCSALQCVAVCCSELTSVNVYRGAVCCSVLQRVAVCCNVLERATIDNVQRGAARGWPCARDLQHTATHCDKLRHTATDCDTLQHAAAHCNTPKHTFENVCYGVATISRHLKILGLFCRKSSLL